jgi:hypothetical protein
MPADELAVHLPVSVAQQSEAGMHSVESLLPRAVFFPTVPMPTARLEALRRLRRGRVRLSELH